MTDTPDISNRHFVVGLLLILFIAVALRSAFPTADPPWRAPVGITWHDEGPWVHNARNKVLWGAWSTDGWNPMYLAPVFTGLEYVAFESFGVGQWQARIVSMAMGTLAILFVVFTFMERVFTFSSSKKPWRATLLDLQYAFLAMFYPPFIYFVLGAFFGGSHVVTDRMQQMRLSQSNPTVKKQRVVGFARRLRDSECGGVSEIVVVAHHKRIECIPGIESELLRTSGLIVQLGMFCLGSRLGGGKLNSRWNNGSS